MTVDHLIVALLALLCLLSLALLWLLARLSRRPPAADPALLQALKELEEDGERVERALRAELAAGRGEQAAGARQLREELLNALSRFQTALGSGLTEAAEAQRRHLAAFAEQLERLSAGNREQLEAIRQDNARQLEQMRATVDEKLQGTLEKRLGESFRQVGERLEQVARGLGEMQSLAAGVGDLKKVLTNVKTRGTWGEVQLGALLEQALAPEQYAANVATRDGGERVEYAIRLPGRGDDPAEPVWLPIDAKFPLEDYQRLAEAQEAGDAAQVESSGRQLEQRILQCARDIAEKYLAPPRTTDFAILFLPTEGLFAEVVRRSGLLDAIQSRHRIVIAGPTTLWSLLNSLQVGFRTLAIQQRSSAVWQLLAAVKSEWAQYGVVLERVQKKLQEASNQIDQAQVRTRAIGRRLRNVQELPAEQAAAQLAAAEEDAAGGVDAGSPL